MYVVLFVGNSHNEVIYLVVHVHVRCLLL